ncbi:universal stress protein [Gordonia sp. NPDC003429]
MMLLGQHIEHLPVTAIPMRDTQPPSALPTVVVGVTDSESSRWAVVYAAQCARDTVALHLVGAVGSTPIRPKYSPSEVMLRTALRDDSYLLEERTMVDEVLRCAREAARAAGAVHVHCVVRSGDTHVVLAREAQQLGAGAVVIGGRPSAHWLARKLCATTDLPVVQVAPGAASASLVTTRPRRLGDLRLRRARITVPTGAPAS